MIESLRIVGASDQYRWLGTWCAAYAVAFSQEHTASLEDCVDVQLYSACPVKFMVGHAGWQTYVPKPARTACDRHLDLLAQNPRK